MASRKRAKPAPMPAAVELGRRGGKARAKSLSKAQKKAIASAAARARWDRRKQTDTPGE